MAIRQGGHTPAHPTRACVVAANVCARELFLWRERKRRVRVGKAHARGRSFCCCICRRGSHTARGRMRLRKVGSHVPAHLA
eukprot:CAMPEP_0179906982 /NCGR_PEP_ID=MMETSP0982-20121206/43584_1 /TAXON_ID=483367 /ORGANISM="non described non described, Strain CCMP 2436" /LENGTH=80 /DNA_ID=CAMNT_0021807625 /DNA_START=493 /DNA_END=732 /DNA_ORIENTATION=+